MRHPIWEGSNVLRSLLGMKKSKGLHSSVNVSKSTVFWLLTSVKIFFFLPTSSCFKKKKSTERVKSMSHFGQKPFIYTSVNNSVDVSFYHTQDFTITVLLHHIETSGTKLFRNMLSVYSVIIIVLCLLCISDLYLTLPVCLDTKTSFKPQLLSVS